MVPHHWQNFTFSSALTVPGKRDKQHNKGTCGISQLEVSRETIMTVIRRAPVSSVLRSFPNFYLLFFYSVLCRRPQTGMSAEQTVTWRYVRNVTGILQRSRACCSNCSSTTSAGLFLTRDFQAMRGSSRTKVFWCPEC